MTHIICSFTLVRITDNIATCPDDFLQELLASLPAAITRLCVILQRDGTAPLWTQLFKVCLLYQEQVSTNGFCTFLLYRSFRCYKASTSRSRF